MKPNRASYIALALIGLTQALSMVDRQILAILVPRIKADLHVGDAEMGLLYGTVFALFYALFSLPLGRLADGWARNKLLSVSILGWSVMTGLAGFANGFGMLALSRLGVGIGEASVQPAGMSLLADRFPKERRGTVTAVIAAAVALGLGGALFIGGATADWWDARYASEAAPLGFKGWQAAFVAAALPGLLMAALLWRMQEPVRGAADGLVQPADPAPFKASWATLAAILPGFNWLGFVRARASGGVWLVNLAGLAAIFGSMTWLTHWTDSLRSVNKVALTLGGVALGGNALQWLVTGFGLYVVLNWLQSLKLRDAPAYAVISRSPALILTLTIASLQSAINYGVMAFSPSFIIKTYAQNPADVGLHFGLLVAGLGIVGPLIAGPLSDWVNKRVPGGRIYVTLVALTVSPFLAFVAYRAPDVGTFYGWFTLYSLMLTMWLPPIYATLLDLVLPRMRGMVMSVYILTMTIIGLGIGPYAVGLMSDRNGGQLGPAILSLYWLGPVLVGLLVALIARLPRDGASLLARARAAGEAV